MTDGGWSGEEGGDDVVGDEEVVFRYADKDIRSMGIRSLDVSGRRCGSAKGTGESGGRVGAEELEGTFGEEGVGRGVRRKGMKDGEREAGGGAEPEHYDLFGSFARREGLLLGAPAPQVSAGLPPRKLLAVPRPDSRGANIEIRRGPCGRWRGDGWRRGCS